MLDTDNSMGKRVFTFGSQNHENSSKLVNVFEQESNVEKHAHMAGYGSGGSDYTSEVFLRRFNLNVASNLWQR